MRPLLVRLSCPQTSKLSTVKRSWPLAYRPNFGQEQWICQHCYRQSHTALYDRKGNWLSTASSLQKGSVDSARSPEKELWASLRRLFSSDAKYQGNKPRNDLPSQEEGRRSHISKRFSHVMDHLQSNIFLAGQRLNDLTGYSGIEALKKDIEQQGQTPIQRF